MTMIQHRYRLTFLTPAFPGNAEQTGPWRTPPFNALLWQWWRVVYASEQGHSANVAAMSAAEASLFGAAADGAGQSNRSRVRLRLGSWDKGRLTNWLGLDSPADSPSRVTLLLWLLLGQWLHVGKGATAGLGGYTMKVGAV